MPVQTYTIAVDVDPDSVRSLRSADVYVEGINRSLATRFFRVNNGAGRVLNRTIGSRASIQWSGQVNKQRGTFNNDDAAFITRNVIAQMQSACGAAGWDVDAIIRGLPGAGSDSTRPNILIGEPSFVRRVVREGEHPTNFSGLSPSILPETVTSGTGAGTSPPTALSLAANRVAGVISDYRTPVIAVSAAVVVTVIGVAAWKVLR